MKVIMRSDNAPDVGIEAAEYVNLEKLDQHIRTLHIARKWLFEETKNKQEAEAAKTP